ncbi:hypothetical protein K2O51_08335 [Cupriavidus pinatubonensis]|nr:hypothetical protein K2O51_08335 [Cupriavidus pinatubonensis]TPQ41717.1 hypothetical protein C2U69_07320 [Cupriavidus pinatubonensis]
MPYLRHVRLAGAAGPHFSRRALAAALLIAVALPASARLPAPTPEQQQATDARKAKEAEEAKRQADALAKVQDQIASRFGKKDAGGAPGATEPGKISQKAAEAPQSAGPHGGTSPSAEAHSGEAARR